MSAPIFADPILDGPADPTVIKKRGTNEWWMFYTSRRATYEGPGVQWIHGSPIGIAVSTDGGHSWQYRGTVEGLDDPRDSGTNTHWAPEVIWAEGAYHMYLSYITGTPDRWEGYERHIVHFVSDDLTKWERVGPIPLSSERVIDAAVVKCPDGLYRLWYKDEGNGSRTGVATSSDLYNWDVEGVAIPALPGHEGPNVFLLDGWWWMIVDEWRGLGVYRSSETLVWERQGLILDRPGSHPLDRHIGRHADVVVCGDWAAIFYFTHPHWSASHNELASTRSERHSTIHWARLSVENDRLICRRDVDPNDLDLDQLETGHERDPESIPTTPAGVAPDDTKGPPQATALKKPRVHESTLKRLAMRILSGEYASGDILPVEAALCADLSVSRSALREVVRVLADKGLVETRPKTGTRIRPRYDWNVLDEKLMGWLSESKERSGFLADIETVRCCLEPEAAELASRHASGHDIMNLETALNAMAQAAAIDDIANYVRSDSEFHRALLLASHNAIYARMINLISVTSELCMHTNAHFGHRPADAIALHAKLVDCIRMREGQAARLAATQLLKPTAPSTESQPSWSSGA